ncbi:MAG: prolyl oligopeptidase family serine peptidase [Synergistaceae bacterium]|nr:prolyl oligopeptidase family serine peptidase [Synergistaceae bacterium]
MRKFVILSIVILVLHVFTFSCLADDELQTMINSTVKKFNQFSYGETGNRISCNLFLPEGYPGSNRYPLVVFIGDESTMGTEIDAPLKQGYGGVIWASDPEQQKHKSLVLVPQFPDNNPQKYQGITENLIRAIISSFQVDTNRVYVTGQSMGCTMLMNIANDYPDLFAGELFVAGQSDLQDVKGLIRQQFIHVVAAGDSQAVKAQQSLMGKIFSQGVSISRAFEWSAKLTQDEFMKALNVVISGSTSAKFIRFLKGTVLPEGVKDGDEHKYSFDAAYRIDALRDWLFLQNKHNKRK